MSTAHCSAVAVGGRRGGKVIHEELSAWRGIRIRAVSESQLVTGFPSRELLHGFVFQHLAHVLDPYREGHSGSGFLVSQAFLRVKADPNSGGQRRGESYEPCIREVIGSTCLSSNRPTER